MKVGGGVTGRNSKCPVWPAWTLGRRWVWGGLKFWERSPGKHSHRVTLCLLQFPKLLTLFPLPECTPPNFTCSPSVKTELQGALLCEMFPYSSLFEINQKVLTCLLVAQHWMDAALGKCHLCPFIWHLDAHLPALLSAAHLSPSPALPPAPDTVPARRRTLKRLGWTQFDSSSVTPITSGAASPDNDVFILLRTAFSVSLSNCMLNIAGK